MVPDVAAEVLATCGLRLTDHGTGSCTAQSTSRISTGESSSRLPRAERCGPDHHDRIRMVSARRRRGRVDRWLAWGPRSRRRAVGRARPLGLAAKSHGGHSSGGSLRLLRPTSGTSTAEVYATARESPAPVGQTATESTSSGFTAQADRRIASPLSSAGQLPASPDVAIGNRPGGPRSAVVLEQPQNFRAFDPMARSRDFPPSLGCTSPHRREQATV